MATLPAKGQAWVVLVVAIACLGIGFAAASLSYRFGLLRVPHEPFVERMKRDLNLTPAQYDQVEKIVRETRAKVFKLRQEFERQRHETILGARAQVRALLTPDQQQKFDREFRPRTEHPESHPDQGLPAQEGGSHGEGPPP
jgi:Spy/CpxP family protein refolding chaperone